MSVEANIIFREKPSAIVVPAEAVAGDAVETVNNGKVERVPVRVGIRGSRNVEIIGDVSRGMAVLSPFRPDLADGTLVKTELNKQAPTPQDDAAPDVTPAQPTNTSALASAAPPPAATSANGDDATISSAITAHIDSVVNDARRNAAKIGIR
jgi:hypothetical protein